MTAEIRPLKASDLPQIGELAELAEMFPAAALADMVRPFLVGDEGPQWLVATDTQGLAGFLYADAEFLTEGTYNILAMATRPAGRGQGIGTRLICEVEDRLTSLGARIVLVETSSGEGFAATRAFYAARGFREEARITGFWAEGEDKIVFWKQLSA